jgi:hypothetical protein
MRRSAPSIALLRAMDAERRVVDALHQYAPRLAHRALDDVEQLRDPRQVLAVVQPGRPRGLVVRHRDHDTPPAALCALNPARRRST